jgi:hypothetical protein
MPGFTKRPVAESMSLQGRFLAVFTAGSGRPPEKGNRLRPGFFRWLEGEPI